MLTRSVTKDCMARAVFEQPPVLDAILRNFQYESQLLAERDMASLLLVFKTPAAVDVIESSRIRLRQLGFRKRMFVAQITELLDDQELSTTDEKHAHVFNFLDALVENKEHMSETLFFLNMSDHIRVIINIINRGDRDPVFCKRVDAYRTKLKF